VTAILPGRKAEPTLAGAEEAALVGETEEIRRLGQRELEPGEVVLGQLAPCAVEELEEGLSFLVQAPL